MYKRRFTEEEAEVQGTEESSLTQAKQDIPFRNGDEVRVMLASPGFESEFAGQFKTVGNSIIVKNLRLAQYQSFAGNKMTNIQVQGAQLIFDFKITQSALMQVTIAPVE